MKLKRGSLLMLISVALCVQDPKTVSALYSVDNLDAGTVSFVYDESFNEGLVNINNYISKKTERIYFPEGFTMDFPEDKYIIEKDDTNYTFKYKDTPDKYADFEVIITSCNMQDTLINDHYFLVSRNEKLALYGICNFKKSINKREILGFRLYYTIPIDNNMFATCRSSIFNDYRLSIEYVNEIVNIYPCYNLMTSNNFTKR